MKADGILRLPLLLGTALFCNAGLPTNIQFNLEVAQDVDRLINGYK